MAAKHIRRVRGRFISLDKALVVGLGFSEAVVASGFCRLLCDALLQQFEVMLLRGGESGGVRLLAEHDDQLITQGLTQLEPQVQGDEVTADQCFLAAGHLHHADQPEQEPEQRDGDQCGDAQEKPGPQFHRQFHRRLLTSCTACVCGTASRRRCPGFSPLDPACRRWRGPRRCGPFPAPPGSVPRRCAVYC
ncbi:hypothetical protein D3C86_1001260 [compost metagenome]